MIFVILLMFIAVLCVNYEVRFESHKNKGLYITYRIYNDKWGYRIVKKLIIRY